ncbi:hypothetical protein ACOME3_009595 [Neoechinorhynchus agilis]
MARPRKRLIGDTSRPETCGSQGNASKQLPGIIGFRSSHSQNLASKIFIDGSPDDDFHFAVPFALSETIYPDGELRLVSRTLRSLGDELDLDKQFQRMLAHLMVSDQSPFTLLKAVASEVFADGSITLGRVLTFVYFAYRILMKNVEKSSTALIAVTITRLPITYSLMIMSTFLRWTLNLIETSQTNEDVKILVTLTISGFIALVIVSNIQA